MELAKKLIIKKISFEEEKAQLSKLSKDSKG